MKETDFIATVAQVQPEQTQFNDTIAKSGNSIAETLLLIFFGIAALGTIAAFLSKEFAYKQEALKLKGKMKKIPCPNCKYFSKSSYLRCAVQPKLTMTEEATSCSDFMLNNKQ